MITFWLINPIYCLDRCLQRSLENLLRIFRVVLLFNLHSLFIVLIPVFSTATFDILSHSVVCVKHFFPTFLFFCRTLFFFISATTFDTISYSVVRVKHFFNFFIFGRNAVWFVSAATFDIIAYPVVCVKHFFQPFFLSNAVVSISAATFDIISHLIYDVNPLF